MKTLTDDRWKRQIGVTAETYADLQIAKALIGEPLAVILEQAVKQHLKPLQEKIDRIKAEYHKG